MKPSLDGVRIKIKRAEQHLEDFRAAVMSELSGPSVTLRNVENLPEGRQVTVDIIVSDPSPDVAVYAGDAIHNLRSALDHIMCQLAVAAGNRTACDTTHFPIYATDKPKHRKRREELIGYVSPAAQIDLRALQPYVRSPADPEADMLAMISGLDNIDKHRLLLVVSPAIADMQLSVTIDDKTRHVALSKVSAFKPLKLKSIPTRFIVPYDSTKPQTQISVKAHTIAGAVFTKTGTRCDGMEAIPTVRAMVAEVKAVVAVLAKHLS